MWSDNHNHNHNSHRGGAGGLGISPSSSYESQSLIDHITASASAATMSPSQHNMLTMEDALCFSDHITASHNSTSSNSSSGSSMSGGHHNDVTKSLFDHMMISPGIDIGMVSSAPLSPAPVMQRYVDVGSTSDNFNNNNSNTNKNTRKRKDGTSLARSTPTTTTTTQPTETLYCKRCQGVALVDYYINFEEKIYCCPQCPYPLDCQDDSISNFIFSSGHSQRKHLKRSTPQSISHQSSSSTHSLYKSG
ncbi:hypothetical protein SAMD00019534_093720 [Acytostelium subglobosum LB1]|uniref:hypothetical protein n=1 Tax=Acytostelium subglobosum LB1 TaxID=1410327 RepID=UPI0006451AA3|nr:hypothetical protein SAMD00019534_093720 [Acytostelium subglobosum LB1]GAM26197.1 hypothetical protein SAMD00019534_093720 [Acytostelium subglobosum LB1]|eukprot:XP_012750751.1 hypothetical protein SAMD00019534_093720 [Acytostelium subglobosum LB1]